MKGFFGLDKSKILSGNNCKVYAIYTFIEQNFGNPAISHQKILYEDNFLVR
jgi:hypothetical protein